MAFPALSWDVPGNDPAAAEAAASWGVSVHPQHPALSRATPGTDSYTAELQLWEVPVTAGQKVPEFLHAAAPLADDATVHFDAKPFSQVTPARSTNPHVYASFSLFSLRNFLFYESPSLDGYECNPSFSLSKWKT